MNRASIPVYDIPSIDKGARHGLLVARLGAYVHTHYEHLHHPHRHSFYHLVLFTEGAGTHAIDFEPFAVGRGQAYFMVPGQVHSWQFRGKVDGYIVHFNESFFSSFLQNGRYLERFAFFQGVPGSSVCQLPEAVLAEAVPLLESLCGEYGRGDAASTDLLRVELLRFFLLVERHCGAAREGQVTHKALLLQHFRRLVEEHYKELRLPREYAALLYITPNHLNALCQDLLGKTAGDVIRDRVLLEAKRLLVHTGGTVAHVAAELQFEDPSYFNRFFKKYEGQTPDQFRKIQLSL
ncbi:helix-turn-helix domain-containing protein [Flaviaesturariibacter flavus]|uniref:Helix-turn-helix domain-containing protein n=1 Tax=Flaviaesturariibacter flavus TaxID=2502780 RepID=A0A4R1B6W2_9BACT|nr:AraC family transcriptional regulator [Flaviaesturariibacter flavus]TCJ12507.1 helix-turn-helix domain-containing protein [Flaviaesturariibacter flavus]